MAEEVRVSPEALSRIGDQLADHGRSLLNLQQSCHRDADGAHPGWVGSSAGTLSQLLDCWTATSASHLARFGDHADGLKVVAVAFLMMDQHGAGNLR